MQRILSYNWQDVQGANPMAVYEAAITMARTNVLQDQFGDMAARAVEINDLILGAVYGESRTERQLQREDSRSTPRSRPASWERSFARWR